MSQSRSLHHVAFIVDGNRRWAKQRGLSVVAGHNLAANETIEQIVYHCLERNIPYVTFWAFSTENWKRGSAFTNLLFGILKKTLEKNVDNYFRAGIRLNTIGDLCKLPPELASRISELCDESKHLNNLTVTIALNYGGRDEIVRAIKRMVDEKKLTCETINDITPDLISQYLDTSDLPDVDLIVRTGGEQRMSGFMPWQSIYAEYAFTDTLFPDLTLKEVDQIFDDFESRHRRFGS